MHYYNPSIQKDNAPCNSSLKHSHMIHIGVNIAYGDTEV